MPRDGRAWTLTFIDFGMMGEVTDSLRRGLQRLMIAVAARDGKGLVDSIQDVGVLLPSADTVELERAMTQLFARFGGMGFAELQQVDPRELRDFAMEFQDVVRSMPFQLPENFLLVIRAMSLTSGMCSGLDPKFNVWDAVEPYAGQLLRRAGWQRRAGDRRRRRCRSAGVYARLPRRLDELTTRLEKRQDRRRQRIARTARGASRAHGAPGRLGGALRRALHRRDAGGARCPDLRDRPQGRRRFPRCFTPCSRESWAGAGRPD